MKTPSQLIEGATDTMLNFNLTREQIKLQKKRQAFGQKIGNNQSIQFKLADMYQKIEISRLLILKAAWESDKGIVPTLNASISKFYATEVCIEVVDEALQILGGYGYTKMFPVEKLYRESGCSGFMKGPVRFSEWWLPEL